MADIDEAFRNVCEKFKISELNSYQKEALRYFVSDKRDVFVNLPTGAGKSMIYLALPTIFDTLRNATSHIVVVVSPLINLMNDQVSKLRSLGISAVTLSGIDEKDSHCLEEGKFSVVYGTPESWIKNERWRKLLRSETFKNKLCGIAVDEAHVIRQWGTSSNNGFSVFRECYGRLHELRSLVPTVKVIALTATATLKTREVIEDILFMDDPAVVYECPSKPNISYSVCYMKTNALLDDYFVWLCNELKKMKNLATRTIIYCQTIRQCSLIYSIIKANLGNHMFTGEVNDKTKVLVEMLHSCTPESNKKAILSAFQDENSVLRVLVATIAFGMGVDCKGVYRTIHFGPSKSIESYIQESGRAGRDNKQSVSYILYKGLMLNHVDRDMKKYLDHKGSNGCRRMNLFKHFDLPSAVEKPVPAHLCCDICAQVCCCGNSSCGDLVTFPVNLVDSSNSSSKAREICDEQVEAVYSSLKTYHKSLVKELIRKYQHPSLKLSNVKFLLGFSELQIDQILQNCQQIFTVDDVLKFVEIWDLKHAYYIIQVFSQIFGDITLPCGVINKGSTSESTSDSEESYDLENNLDDLIKDDELFDLAMQNLSSFILDHSINESFNDSIECELPDAAANALEHLSLVTTGN